MQKATASALVQPHVAGEIKREQWHPLQTVITLANGEIEPTLPYANATEPVRDILKWGEKGCGGTSNIH